MMDPVCLYAQMPPILMPATIYADLALITVNLALLGIVVISAILI